jgi:hypothetical protein
VDQRRGGRAGWPFSSVAGGLLENTCCKQNVDVVMENIFPINRLALPCGGQFKQSVAEAATWHVLTRFVQSKEK